MLAIAARSTTPTRLKKPGWYRCAEKECRKDFTVTTGTVMERSHIALNKWLMAFYLLNACKKGISAHQLHRALKLDYKSAWFMCHRIREAMRAGGLGPLGGDGKIVEADETYYGKIEKPRVSPSAQGPRLPKRPRGPRNKRPIVALVERGGNVRTFHVPVADKGTVGKIVRDNIARKSRLHTDESSLYPESARTVRGARDRQALRWRIRPYEWQRRPYQFSGRLFFDLQARNARRLSALQREASCIAILPSSTTATIIAWRSATATSTAPLPRSVASKASG